MATHQNSAPQKLGDGVGAAFHRVYSVVFPASAKLARQAMRDLKADPNQFSPQWLARFEKTKGVIGKLRDQDEFHVHITGPWDGPVRVAQVEPLSFLLLTLEGHLEAGRISFRLFSEKRGFWNLEIESLARSRDAVVDLLYDKIPIARLAQTEMWTNFCRNFALHAAGLGDYDADEVSEVKVITERKEMDERHWELL